MNQQIRSVQIFRAVGASAVLYYHSVDAGGKFSMPSTGPWGVDLFFVISGFVIGLVVFKNTSHFFLRRVFRVVPLYAIATLGWATAVLLIPARANSTEVTLGGLIKSLLFIPYKMPLRDGPILQLGWTLNYEMFFYLTVAVCLLLLTQSKKTLLAVTFLLGMLVVSGYVFPATSYVLSVYQSPLLLEFLSGVGLSALFIKGVFNTSSKIVHIIAAVIIVFSFALLVAQDTQLIERIASHRAFYYGIPSIAIIAGGLLIERYIKDNKITAGLLALGSASYAMYLFHPFVAVFLSEIILVKFIEGGNMLSHILLFLVVYAAVCFVSIAIDKFLDQPLQKRLRKLLPSSAGTRKK